MANTSKQVTHLDNSRGLAPQTMCGRSLHGWYIDRPKNVTNNKYEVTCISCQKKMRKN